LFLLISIYSFSLLFTIFYSYFLFVGYFIEGHQRDVLMGGLTAPEQAALEQPPQLMTDDAMNQAFGTSSEEDEGEEDEGEEVDEEEMDGGQQHNYMFLFLVNFYSQLD
jgi:hypothetical protein